MEHFSSQESIEKPRKVFLYHGVPDQMKGDVLYPLNELRGKLPDVYEKQKAKYEDRPHIMEQTIPSLRARWNDVLHFTAVDPQELKQALLEAGVTVGEMKFYKIDPILLDPSQTVVYLNRERGGAMHADSFIDYDPEKLEAVSALPQSTKDYYRSEVLEGRNPLRFARVPHILHKGTINVSKLPIIVV